MGEGAVPWFHRFRSLFVLGASSALFAMAVLPAVSVASSSTLPGIDISHHNGTPDWDKVKQAGVRFVIAKATEGDTFTDPQYTDNKAQVETHGIAFTAYHFARPDRTAHDAVSEADYFVGVAALVDTNLVPVLDLEDSGGLSTTRLTTWVKDWLAEVHAKLGVKATIYTTASFWKQHLGNTAWFARNGYRLWIANWTTASQPAMPASNWAGRGWTLWQYDDCGSVSGITGCVDTDRFKGTSLGPLKIKNNR
jgi:GH25 family lysozyme M1 (1,4-beta-N-acetylmuramidase)